MDNTNGFIMLRCTLTYEASTQADLGYFQTRLSKRSFADLGHTPSPLRMKSRLALAHSRGVL